MADTDWMNNESLHNIDKSKLEALQELANQGGQKNQTELMNFLMAFMSSNGGNKPQFSSDEVSLILQALKKGKSPKEQAKMDRVIQLMQMIRKNK
jgi:hypothetical protein